MGSLASLSGEQLLKSRAIDLFKVEAGSLEAYRELVKKWHPDINRDPLAGQVFAHITEQFQAAKRAWVDGTYPNTLTIQKSTGTMHYPYLSVIPFELGELYICERHLIWATRRENDDLAKRWLSTVKNYKFPNDEVKAKIVPYIPRNSHTVANGDRAYTIVDRPGDYIRLADILAKKGPMNPRHVAWVMSRAYNLAGFLSYAKITHLDFTPETFFIEPASHLGALLGGWFYTAHRDEKLIAAPARTAHLVKNPANVDAQIRLMGRRLLGGTSPVTLRANKDLPAAMREWVMGTPKSNIHEAHKTWTKDTVIAAFGERKFVEYDLTTKEIYA